MRAHLFSLIALFSVLACGGSPDAPVRSSRSAARQPSTALQAWGSLPPGDYLAHDETLTIGEEPSEIRVDLIDEWPVRVLDDSRLIFSFGGSEIEGHGLVLFAPLTCAREPLRFAHDGLVIDVPAGGRVALHGVSGEHARVGPPIAEPGGMTALIDLASVGLAGCAPTTAPSGARALPTPSQRRGRACAFGRPSLDPPLERVHLPPGSAFEIGERRDEWLAVTAWTGGARVSGWLPAAAIEPAVAQAEPDPWVRTTRTARVGPFEIPAGALGRIFECPPGVERCDPRVALDLEHDGRRLRVFADIESLEVEPASAPTDAPLVREPPHCEYPDAPASTAATGRLSRQRIRAAITEQIAAVRACYEQALDVWPRLEGRVMASFIIGPTGRVDAVGTSGDLPVRFVHQCIAGVVRQLRFPQPSEGGIVGVNYPFILSSSD